MFDPSREIRIEEHNIGEKHPTYFIADIAANHDGDLGRAKELIYKCKEAGADAAKFQHFRAETIVSDEGFRALGQQQSHQASWKKSVFEVYKSASVSTDWTESLKETCDDAGITFFTSAYDFDLVDHIDSYVPAYKIGSGDITWIDMICHIASKNKPYIIASGASNFDDVIRAVDAGLSLNPNMMLLQCNTNYTGSIDNMRNIQLNVLRSYRMMYPTMVLGLSDHTPGHATVLGAVSLGARVIEKHFTDDCGSEGPDHAFSMDPVAWSEMVLRTRELEAALGAGVKRIEDNEAETVVLQRRAIRARRALAAGDVVQASDLCVLRPCPQGAMAPYQMEELVGKTLRHQKARGDHFTLQDWE